MNRLAYLRQHWKLGMHLIFKTRRFGVNNRWWSPFPSLWGLPWYRVLLNCLWVYPLIKNFQAMKTRMGLAVAFVPREEYEKLFVPKNKVPSK